MAGVKTCLSCASKGKSIDFLVDKVYNLQILKGEKAHAN
jgi:hypothetical protein